MLSLVEIINKFRGSFRETSNIRYTRHRTKTNNIKTQHRTLTKDEQHGPHQKPGMKPAAREGHAVPASFKTLTVLLIYTVKSNKSLDSDRGKKPYAKSDRSIAI